MLPNPYLRPREPQYFAYPGAHHLLYHLPTTQLFTPTPAQQQRAPTRETNTSAIHPYTPYRAHDSALSTPSLPRSLQDNLLRRKTPAGILPASYDAAPSQWPSRPAKHILLPLITETGELQHVPDVKHIPTDGAGSSIKHGTTLIDNDLGRLMKSTHGTPISHLNSSAWIGAQLPPQRQQKLARPSGQQSFMVTQQQPASPHGGEPVPSNATNNPLVQAVYQPVFVSWQPNELTVAYMPDGAGVGYYLPNGLGSTPQRAPIINPTIPQLTPDSVYQINNSSIAPADVQHAAPMYMITPGWDQAPRRNSGQPQAYRTIDAVVTSPNPLPLQHPIVADPVHHQVISEGVQGLPPIQQQFTQSAASVRSRVMTWAHGVYTDLVQSLQANQSTPNVVHVVSQQPTPNDTPLPADRLHQLNHLGTTLSQYPPNRDRRKRRRIDDIPEHGEHYFQHNSGCPTNSGYPSPQVHRTELKKENNDYHNISFSFTGYESPLATPNQQSPEFQVVDPLGGYSQVTNLGGVGDQIGGRSGRLVNPSAKNSTALQALDSLHLLCVESGWRWLDGMLLGGCIAYVWSLRLPSIRSCTNGRPSIRH